MPQEVGIDAMLRLTGLECLIDRRQTDLAHQRLRARLIRLMEMVESVGLELLREPLVKHLDGSHGSFYTVPYVFLVVSAALQRVDPAMEEASRTSGAGPLKTMFRVTLPAIKPAFGAAILLGFISGVSLFSVPRFSAVAHAGRACRDV